MIVNWVKEDEELLEPYEWDEGDDIEIITNVKCIRITEETMYDFIYGCLFLHDTKYKNRIFVVGDGKYAVAIETDGLGKLCYRSLLNYCDRHVINEKIHCLPLTTIHYQKYDEGEIKEYGLTRDEKLKKQYINHHLDDLYINNYDEFENLCLQLHIKKDTGIKNYQYLHQLLEKGYTFIHEVIFHELTKIEHKKK